MTNLKLAVWRKAHGLTQSQLGALLGLHPRTIASWEQERQDMPSTLVALALKELHRVLSRNARN